MNIKKILFFKPGAIGDFLHTLPALRALKKHFPFAQVTVVVSPGQEGIIEGTDVADRVIAYEKSRLKRSLADFLRFGLLLRRDCYDLFVDMQPSFRSFLLRRLSGAALQLVYRKQKHVKPGVKRMHAVENFLETLKPLGISDSVRDITLSVRPDAAAAVERFLQRQGINGSKPIIALNCSVGSARPARNWFPERFSALADRSTVELGAAVVFVGGSEDRDLVRGVLAGMKGKAVSAAGEMSLPETVALLSRCRCLVSSDTGPLHLATAVGTPVVGLYGSTDPLRTGPVGAGHQVLLRELACVPCEEKDCPLHTRECMAAITVDDVFQALRRALS